MSEENQHIEEEPKPARMTGSDGEEEYKPEGVRRKPARAGTDGEEGAVPMPENPLDTQSSAPNPSTLNPKPSEMEVHHHAHAGHGKKTWKEYFWEFLMLFLAVFCGFLAEYQLEHKIERDRAKELAKSFYQELKNDSVTAVIKSQNRIRQEKALKYLIGYFKDSSLARTSKEFAINFEYGINFRTPTIFEPRTIILEQLKNSGSLRYFKNYEFQKLVGDLTVAIKNINDRQDLETHNRLDYINPVIIDHYDYNFDARMKEGGKSIFEGITQYEASKDIVPYVFKGADKIDIEHTINVLCFYSANVINSTRVTFIQKYRDVNAELLKELRNEYDLQ